MGGLEGCVEHTGGLVLCSRAAPGGIKGSMLKGGMNWVVAVPCGQDAAAIAYCWAIIII